MGPYGMLIFNQWHHKLRDDCITLLFMLHYDPLRISCSAVHCACNNFVLSCTALNACSRFHYGSVVKGEWKLHIVVYIASSLLLTNCYRIITEYFFPMKYV